MALTADQQSQVDALKRLLGGALQNYSDDQLWALISSGATLNAIASQIWAEYAAATATLVNMSEGSSRRELGNLYNQAQKMSLYFRGLDANTDPTLGRTITRPIVRPGR